MTRNTILLNALFIVVVYSCSITLALLLNEVRSRRFVKVTQSAILLPYFISWVIVSYMVYGVLNSDTGALNKFMLNLGLIEKAVPYYAQPNSWYVILVVLRVWKYIGWTSIIFLAAITGIDSSMYEAAYIDGANRFQCTRYLTLPLLMPTLSVLVLIEVGPAEKSDSRYGRSFKQLLVLSQPILQSNLRSSARAKKELKGSAAGAQRSLPG